MSARPRPPASSTYADQLAARVRVRPAPIIDVEALVEAYVDVDVDDGAVECGECGAPLVGDEPCWSCGGDL